MSRRADSGFTLLEAIVALTIVAMVGVAALGALGSELRTADRANRSLEAGTLAEERMAAIELLSPYELASPPDSLERGAYKGDFDAYDWVVDVRPVLGELDLYDISVEVRSESVQYELGGRLFRPPETPLLP